MSPRVRFSTLKLLLAIVFVLVACGGPPATQAPAATQALATGAPAATEALTEAPVKISPLLQIVSITNNPADAYPAAGEVITFSINYRNVSADEVLTDSVLQISHSTSLVYCEDASVGCESNPAPDTNPPEAGSLTYTLGDVSPGDGTVKVSFKAGETPSQEPVGLDIKITGTTPKGDFSEDNQSIAIYADFKDEIYREGAILRLPWKISEKAIHSERNFEFDFTGIGVVDPDYQIIQPVIYLDVFDENHETIKSFAPSITLYAAIPEGLKADLKANPDAQVVLMLYDTAVGEWLPCNGSKYSDSTVCSETTVNQDTGYASINIDMWTSGAGWGCRGCSR